MAAKVLDIRTPAEVAEGKLEGSIVVDYRDANFADLISYLKDKNFTATRKWVGDSDVDVGSFYRAFFNAMEPKIGKPSIPYLVILIAKYQYQGSFVVNQDINLMAFLAEVMAEVEFV